MPGLLIKNLSPRLHRKLKEAAAGHHRSMTRHALALLEEALVESKQVRNLPRALRGPIPLTRSFVDRAKRTGRP